MRTGIYFCNCGSNITERIDFEAVRREFEEHPDVAYVTSGDFLCSEDGLQWFEADVAGRRPDRVVVAACSPREYERAFMGVLERAGMNPYFLQMVNIREQVAWVTPDIGEATRKACAQIRGAVGRVARHEALQKQELEICPDVVVIGGGPAGLKAALMVAEAGRKAIVVEKSPAIGGLPVLYEELFPNLECGPCMLEPMMGEALHGRDAANLEILTMAQVTGVTGYYGNFTVTIRQSPRYVDLAQCIGCGECVPPCPATAPNEFNFHLDRRKAIATAFPGALPNTPFLDAAVCRRSAGEDCTLCRDACPVAGAIRYEDTVRTIERRAGAIVVAIGGNLFDARRLPELGYGTVPGVYTSLEFERMVASNGPSGGELHAESVAIVHCAGSMDAAGAPYCSGVCCQYAFKFNQLIAKKLPEAKIHHFYEQLVMPGKEAFALYRKARDNPNASFLRTRRLRVTGTEGKAAVESDAGTVIVDMVVLCPPMTGSADSEQLSGLLRAPRDSFGFFQELHGRLDATRSKIQGIYLAGACQAPMDIQGAMGQGTAAAGYILAGLVAGRKLEIEPITAAVDEARCSLCRTCGLVCPYQAIRYPDDAKSAQVNALLCHGCGTCVAACPSGAMQGNHFTDEQILAEMEAVLQ